MGTQSYDVVIVGGGLAGITAARDLSADGRKILLIEARDHLGGRAWSRPFAGTDIEIPLGGTYLVRQAIYEAAFREVERYGVALEPPPMPKTAVSLLCDERFEGRLPVPPDEWRHLERVAHAVLHAIGEADGREPIERQISADLDVSCADFLESLDLPRRTFEFVAARAQCVGQRPIADFSIGVLAHQIIGADRSVINYSLSPVSKISGGTKVLYDAIFGDAQVECQLSNPVTSIEQTADAVAVTCADGEYTGRACVVATPITMWPRIVFDPPLSKAKSDGAGMQPLNACRKVWAIVKDAAPDCMGIGNVDQSQGFVMLLPDQMVDDGQLMVGFAPGEDVLDAEDPIAVERAFQAFLPGCSVVAFDSHNWIADPFSKGAWMAPPPGYITKYAAKMRTPEKRLAFATADIARHGMSNMSGAIQSGIDAAQAVEEILERGAN